MPEPKLTEEDKEELKKQKLAPNGLPEAPASFNIIFYKDSFRCQITLRAETLEQLYPKIKELLEHAKESWKPSWKEEPENKAEKPKEEPKTKTCNECGGIKTLKVGVTKGRRWVAWFCENKECPPEWVNLSKK